MPPAMRRADGGERRVGFELEFTGLTLEQAAEAVRDALGGRLAGDSAAEFTLEVDGLGAFSIEIDWDYLKRKAAAAEDGTAGGDWIDILKSAAALVVPVEVVCPPIGLSRLGELDAMVAGLRGAGAAGTGDSLLAAFGVHINVEAPRTEPSRMLPWVKAFALLQWWLVEAHAVDLARKVTPYVDLYPQSYLEVLLAAGDRSDAEVMADYLAHNATRNRALDLLPMLAAWDEDAVQAVVADARVKPRPAFHYRLPNCHIEDAEWSLAAPWNLWVVVERLAAAGAELDALAKEYLARSRPLLGVGRGAWVEYIGAWLGDRRLA